MDRDYYYLGGNTLHTGIYVDLIRGLEGQGLVVHLVPRVALSTNPASLLRAWRGRHRLGPNRLEDVARRIRGRVLPLPTWNVRPGLSAGRLARIAGLPAAGRTVVMHARQVVMARLALSLKRRHPALRVISEFEGDDLAQIDYAESKTPRPTPRDRLRWTLERRYYDTAYRRILRESDAVNCVSRNLRDELVRRYRIDDARVARIHVIPTIASREEFRFDAGKRERTRAALGIGDRYLVVYSGNLRGRWQVPEELVEAFQMVRQVRPDAYFLVLTPDAERSWIEPHLARAGIAARDHRVTSCPHDEVVDHLCAGDVGLLLRDRHLMNEVAAPGKFGEYALTGLPIVMTDGIGDFSGDIRDAEWACLLPDLVDRATMRERIAAFCRRRFTVEDHAAFCAWSAGRFATEISLPRLADLHRTI